MGHPVHISSLETFALIRMLFPDNKALPRCGPTRIRGPPTPNRKGGGISVALKSQLLMWLDGGDGMGKGEVRSPNHSERLPSTDETADIPDTVLALGRAPRLKVRGGGGGDV